MWVKKSGTYWSFLLFGVLIESILVVLMKIPLNFDLVLPFLGMSLAFLFYRVLIDWRFFNNYYSRELRSYVVSNSEGKKLAFSVIGGFVVAFFNISLGLYFADLFLYGFVSVLLAWIIFDSFRSLWNDYFRERTTKNFRRDFSGYHESIVE